MNQFWISIPKHQLTLEVTSLHALKPTALFRAAILRLCHFVTEPQFDFIGVDSGSSFPPIDVWWNFVVPFPGLDQMPHLNLLVFLPESQHNGIGIFNDQLPFTKPCNGFTNFL